MKYQLVTLITACSFGLGMLPGIATADDLPWYRRYWDRNITRAVATLDTEPVQEIVIPILFGITLDDITPNFGDPRSGGRSHEGLDMLAPIGTPIISPTDAVVTHIRYGDSAGHSVYTANPGGETFAYLHLDSVYSGLSVGNVVSKGDLLGYVGDTGNAKGGPAHLHFEILDKTGANDPYPRIAKEISPIQKEVYYKRIIRDLSDTEKEQLEGLVRQYYSSEIDIVPVTTVSENELDSYYIGQRGADIVALQELLIAAQRGTAAAALAEVGATGYYGPLTQAAVEEYEEDSTGEPSISVPSNEYVSPVAVEENSWEIPRENLTLGSKGATVVALQEYILANTSGSAVQALREVGATGYFGSLTQAALAAYQEEQGIRPAIGYYGPVTRAHILAQ